MSHELTMVHQLEKYINDVGIEGVLLELAEKWDAATVAIDELSTEPDIDDIS